MQDKSSLSGLRIGNIFGNISEYINKLRETTNGISLGDTFNNSISKDTIALNNFTKKFAECKSAETAFEATMKGASVSAQAFALKMHETGASVDDFVKSQKMQEVALISQNKSLTNVRGLLDEYNLGCKNVGLTQQDFVQSVGQSNRVLGNYLSSVGDGEATMGGYVKSMISAKLATVGLQAATIALNTAISMGVALAIQTIITLCDKLIVTEKEVAEAAEKAMSQYKEAQETLKSNKATIDEISSDYEKLSKGVDKFGNNISLSTSEYERYHEITSKIKNMFPEMISGYDSEGNAIVKTKGDVEALTKAYEEQAQVARQSLLYEGNKIFENYKNNTEGGFFDGWTLFTISDAKIDQQIRAIEKILDESKSEADLFNDFDMTALTSVFEGAGIDWSWWDNTPFGKSSIKRARENQDVLRQYLNTLKGLRETEVAPAKTVIDAYLESTENKKYQSLSQNSKDAVKSIVQQLDHEFYDQFKTMPDAENAVMQRIVELISKNNSLTNAFDYMSNAQEKLAQGKITMGEYQEEITRFVKSIGELDGETQKYAKMSFGLELDKNNVSKDIQNVINQLKSLGIDKQFGDGASELFVNKLSLPEFSQMLNNGGQFKDSITKWLQENQGATAAQFSDWFNSVLSESANSVSDSSSVILNAFDKAATGITEFKNAMDSSKGSIKSGTEAFEGYADAYTNAMKLINEGYDLDNGKLYAYMELLLGKDTLEKYGYNVDTLKGKLKELKGVYGDKNSLGDGFLDKLKKSVDKNGDLKLGKETIATFDKKSGEWSVDNNHFADVAKALGMTEDGLVACIQAMSTWSDVALESLGEIKARAESAGAVYHEQFDKELKGKDIVNLNTLRDNMKSNGYTDKQTYDAIEQLKSDKNVITIDVKADSSAKDIIEQLSKVNLIGKDSEGKSVLDLSGTVEMLKSTGSSITDITDIITTLNDSDSIQVKVDGKSIEDLGVLRTKIEELYNTTSTQVQRANEVLKELGLTDFNFVFDSNSKKEVEDGLINIRTILESLKKDGKLDLSVDGATEAQLIFSQLMHEQQELNAPTVMKVDTSQLSESQESVKTAIQKIQEFKRICNEIEINQELGIDTTEAEKKANSLANQIKGIDSNILTTLSLDTSSVDSLKASINNVTGEQLVKVGIDQKAIIGWKPDDKNAKVKFTVDSTDVDKYKKQSDDKTAIVHFSKDSTEVDRYDPKDLKRTVTYRVRTEGSVEANGTAHLSGTAKASGDWGTAKGGTSLVGELGEEVIVDPHTGRWYTVGENGAEFRDIPQGAIVFNHKQTESLLKYGHINSRGTSLVGGTALASGTAYASGVTSSRSSATSTTKKKKKTTTKSTKKSSSKSLSKKSSKSSSKTNNDDYTDWIEIAISRVERVITNLETKAKNSYQALSERLKATSDEIPQINKEINVQQKGADRYLKQANSVKLSSDLKKKVREGTIDIKKYDESTQKLITSYKKWYDKSLACSDAVTKLKQSLAALYKERFETVQKDYNNQLSVMESKANILNEKVSALEASGYLKSSNVYSSLKSNKLQEVKKMEEEKSSLEKMLAEGVKSGTIVKYSEAWYSMSQQIDSTALSIAKAKTELIGYDNTIRKIDWEHFDYLQDRISQIPTEAKFLSELLDEEKLYEDNGAFTKYGTAKLGLNVQDYNVYTNQAKQYAQEISAVNKLLAEDPFNTNLISRREELLKLQRESIKSANEEKKAVKSLVEEGIKKELSSVKELIDSYTSQLDCTKDLYDYQKKISDKTSNIASLNKQLAAYSNDLSEESKSKVQKLKVELDKAQTELQETQYERSISEQKKLLDNFYSDYEETLNKRLDDVDGLLSNMTDVVNANGSGINQTLKEISSAVGYGITAITESIWNNSSGIDESVNGAIGSTKSNVANMVANSNAYVKKYATGGLVDYTGIAKVDGSKSKPELVLNPQDTQNLLAVVSKIKDIPITVAGQEFAGYKSMVQHAIASPDLYGKMSTIQNHTVNQEVSNNVTLNVNIDHVENYEDFVDKLKRDSQFEKMVQSMTVDRMVGGSALSKHKYSWK